MCLLRKGDKKSSFVGSLQYARTVLSLYTLSFRPFILPNFAKQQLLFFILHVGKLKFRDVMFLTLGVERGSNEQVWARVWLISLWPVLEGPGLIHPSIPGLCGWNEGIKKLIQNHSSWLLCSTVLWESSEARKSIHENVRKEKLFRKACNIGEFPIV